MNRPEDFVFSLVEVDDDHAVQPGYIRRLFDKKRGFTKVSVNHDLKEPLELSEGPI